jgi:CMP-N,N'-diacetyllegionaminic acid synthase
VHEGRRVLGLIPARGGSKGIPGKNTALLGGRPLIAWTIAAATASRSIDEVVVTTDDEEIAAAAKQAGARVPFRRPAELATDDAHMTDVIAHALETLEGSGETFGWLALLQPTSPLRESRHVDEAFARLGGTHGSAVVSVCEAEHSPAWLGHLPEDGRMSDFIAPAAGRANRQELGRYFRLNGAIYLADVAYWRVQAGFLGPETFAYVMPAEASVDVDAPLDLEFAEFLLARREGR